MVYRMTPFPAQAPWPVLKLLQVHCQGEIGKVIVEGAPPVPGATMMEKMAAINHGHDSLRRFVTLEPRAHAAMSVNLLVPPTRPDADAGFIVLQSDRAHPMSGSNCLCVVTALLESRQVPMCEPRTVLHLDTPAGLVRAVAHCANGRCLTVTLRNVAAFAHHLAHPVNTRKWGRMAVDIVFGGVYYALVNVRDIGLEIRPEHARDLAEAGAALKREIAAQVSVSHPDLPGVDTIAYVMFRDIEPDGAVRTCTILDPARVDRSPCGTGSSANLATLYARGLVRRGDTRVSRSIGGGEFTLHVADTCTVGEHAAIIPEITGSAWIYGREELRIDPTDPFPQGFALSDTWGAPA